MTQRLHQHSPTRGILFMLLGIAILCAMDATAKLLLEHSVHTIQILALRSIIIVPVIVLVYSLRGKARNLVPTRPVAQIIRGLIGTVAPVAFFFGIARLPLTSAVVVFFSSIFMTTLLSVFFLGEKVGLHRWVAVGVGYCGVIIAMSPTAGGDITGYLLILLSSLMYTILFISGRRLSATESVSSLVLFYNLGVGLITGILLPWFWQPLSYDEWILVTLLAGFAVGGHFCVTYAFAVAEASLITPFEYTAVVWALMFDFVLWQQTPGLATWIGAGVIISSGLYVIHRENLHARHTNGPTIGFKN